MNSKEQYTPILFLFLAFLITAFSSPLMSQSVIVSANLPTGELLAGDEVDVVFKTEGTSDFYFFSVETEYDPDIFEYVEVSTTGISDGGLKIGEIVSSGVIGASVSRTESLELESEGDVMILTFRVKEKAPAGDADFSFSNAELSDSNGDAIDFDGPADTPFTVGESISITQLTTPASFELTEGDEFNATGQVFANGVTLDENNSSRVKLWIGVNSENTDPSEWEQDVWQPMEFVEQDSDDFFTYTGEIAFQREVGTYSVALRAELDGDGNYAFGGINGTWDETESPSAEMNILEKPPFRYTIALWDFENDTLIPSLSIPENAESELEIYGASFKGINSGGEANSDGWDTFVEGENYWQVVVNTENMESLKLSSIHDGTGTGPRDFQLQWSTDGNNWTDVAGGEIKVGDSTMDELNQVDLPADLENQQSAYIRWVQDSDIRVDEDESKEISPGGTNKIDDILITGVNPNAARVDVWPGDTDADGTVNENDVLPLGEYWLSEGPQPIFNSIDWAPREVETWFPVSATHADADGSGRVDQNDLQVVGLNFNETTGGGGTQNMQLDPPAALAELRLEALNAGETAELFIMSKGDTDLSGISFRMEVAELTTDDWSAEEIEPMDWGREWAADNRLIEFQTLHDNYLAAAMVHKGAVPPVTARNLVKVVLKAENDWNRPVTARVLKASVSTDGNIHALNDLELATEMAVSVEPSVDERPRQTALLQNYPNPFNPTTTIPYTLAERGDVEIQIFDSIGRRVYLVTEEGQQAGRHTVTFDASSLSSGIYFYSLRVNGTVQTRRMTLIK